jgi:hypothetical protein
LPLFRACTDVREVFERITNHKPSQLQIVKPGSEQHGSEKEDKVTEIEVITIENANALEAVIME